ncbi:MAG: beta-galactosidase trimerization domain-containing protein, partial [Armatimonadota bacterium]
KLLGSDGRLLHEARQAFYIRQPGPPRDELSVLVFGPDGRYPSRRIAMNRFVEMGMNAGLNAHGLAPANVHPVKYDFRLVVRADEQGHVSPDITSPSYIQYVQGQMKKTALEVAPFSPLLYYLGDDVRYLSYGEDGGWNPEMRVSLAEWAKQTYGDLGQINQAWETTYETFDEIEPVTFADALAGVRDADRPRYGPLCHWVDHQLHTDRMFTRFHRLLGDAINEVDPDTPSNIGSFVVGWTPPGSGFDFWQLSEGRQLGFQYPNPWVHEIFRSALAPGALQGTWYGGYGLYNYPPAYLDQDFLPWWSVFHGLNVHGLYFGGISARWFDERLLGPDLSFMPGVAKIVAQHDELRSGLAKLLFNARKVNDGVAIVYSPDSIHASAVFDRGLPKAPEWDAQDTGSDLYIYMQCWEGLMYLLGDLGLSFDVVPSSHLGDGQFLERGFRVLVMPLNLRVTAAEVETIRQFISDGGVLIADAFPGMFDGRCRADHSGVLADVFGVKFAGGIPGASVRREAAVAAFGAGLPVVVADAGITLAGAEARGETESDTPIFLVHRYGKGTAIVLNVLARDYQIWRTAATEMPFRQAVGGLLADAGIEPYPEVKCVVGAGGSAEHPLQATEVHRYEIGGARYVGLLRHHKLRPDEVIYMADLRPKAVSVTFDRPWHIYEMRSGMYRGYTDAIEDMIYPAVAELYALLPYEVRDLEMQAEWESGAVVVSAEVIFGDAEVARVPHVFHIVLTDPEGRQRPELSRNIVAENGRCRERIFVGYNAIPEGWRITVRDAASGMRREASLGS